MAENNFIFHKVSEHERNEIKKEAKKIMDSFDSVLRKVEKKLTKKQKQEDFFVEREKNYREEKKQENEKKQNKENKEFRKLMMKNAPKIDKNKDYIIAEKGGWNE